MNSLHHSCRVLSIAHLVFVEFLLIWMKVLFRDSQANNDEGKKFTSTASLFKRTNLYFCQQICCLFCCEYWIMVTQTTNSAQKKVDAKLFLLSCFIYFHINWIFPSEKHETSLGILRVKPELSSSISSAGFFFLSSLQYFSLYLH